MATDTRTADEIERDVHRERSDLTQTIETLPDRFSAENVVRAIGHEFREHGSEIGQPVSRSVKENPMALALTGIGLAWLIFGEGPRRGGAKPINRSRAPNPPPAPMPAAPRPAWLSSVDDSARYGDDTERSGSRLGDAARSAGASASETASRVRARLSEGTESLSGEARGRVVAAREQAWCARAAADRQARRGAASAQEFYFEQPLATGAMALAVGAAIGGSLPRTESEDAAFGQQSDDLIAEAERIFREETEKARGVAEATVDEAKSIASEKRAQADAAAPGQRTAGEAARDEAAAARTRLAERARTEADVRNLGKPGS